MSKDQQKDKFVGWQSRSSQTAEGAKTKSGRSVSIKDNFKPLYEHEALPTETEVFTPLTSINQDLSKNKADSPQKPPQKTEKPTAQNPPADDSAAKKESYQKGFAKGEKEGFAKGEKEGYKTGLKKAEEMVQHLQQLLTQADGLWGTLLSIHEKQILELVNRAAEQVVYGIVETDHEVVKRAVLNAFQKIPETIEAEIQINPDDYDFIETIKEDIFEHVKALQNIAVVSNPAIARGGCKINTVVGEIDSELETRLRDIKKNIIEAYNQKAAAAF